MPTYDEMFPKPPVVTEEDSVSFLRRLAPHILADLKPPSGIKQFTHNSTLVGEYVEESVRKLVRGYLDPIRVCSGGVIDETQKPGAHVNQIDTIAWIPGPVPAVFEVGRFGLVPRSSSLGILEIKSSAYDVPELAVKTEREFVNSITASPVSDEASLNTELFGRGVVALLLETQKSSKKLVELRKSERVFVLFEENGDNCDAQENDIYGLVNFLSMLRRRASLREGLLAVRKEILFPEQMTG
jgi:hypothetical protein